MMMVRWVAPFRSREERQADARYEAEEGCLTGGSPSAQRLQSNS